MRSLLLALMVMLAPLAAVGMAHAKNPPAPLKVLYFTGGGWHDYDKLAKILTEGMVKYARVEFTVRKDFETLRDPKLGEGFDCIMYNFCYTDHQDKAMIENCLRVTREGKPTVMVHCAMHCFQSSDDWTACCGLRTRSHDGYRAFSTKRSEPVHPTAKAWPADWSTKGDELYRNIKFGENSTPILTAYSPESKVDHVVAWAHEYGKAKVFATTLGHDTNTAAQDDYHRLLANAVLWTCGKLSDDGSPAAGYAPEKAEVKK